MRELLAVLAVLMLTLVACAEAPADDANVAGDATADPVLESFDEELEDTDLGADEFAELDQLEQDLQFE